MSEFKVTLEVTRNPEYHVEAADMAAAARQALRSFWDGTQPDDEMWPGADVVIVEHGGVTYRLSYGYDWNAKDERGMSRRNVLVYGRGTEPLAKGYVEDLYDVIHAAVTAQELRGAAS